MKIDFCTLADYANQGDQGKLNIIGVFDRISAKSFPARHRSMVFVVRILTEYEDSETQHSLVVRCEGPDGQKLFQLEGGVEIGTLNVGEFSTQNQVLNINNLQFERSGTYMFRVFIDGELRGESPLLVRKVG